ncbi:MAG TPA: ABC transporter permease, partial [Alphaproteobacteria bacterium]|nr:ABC transporter permease [Alphaproteobacteria bacterium]
MIAFIVRRLVQSVFVMLAVGFVAFAMFNYVGDPIAIMVGQDTPIEQRVQLRKALGLDDPAPVRFARFVGNAVEGKFGLSYRTTQPVADMILTRLPATLELSFVAVVMALALGLPMGVFAGLYPHHWLSRILLTVSLV